MSVATQENINEDFDAIVATEDFGTTVEEAATEETAVTGRTFLGSTLKELFPVLIALGVALVIAGFIIVTEIQFEIAEAEMRARTLAAWQAWQEAAANKGIEKP